MKVIVCFDNVRVTVPCGDGTIPVRELINKAVHRYKRATGKGSSHWVEVTSLKTISGGGILDLDDQLNDVVDDKEQLIAEFEEQERSSIQHNGGDGASASSTGTTSPEIFQAGNGTALPLHDLTNTSSILGFLQPCQNSTGSNNVITDVVVTSRDLMIGSNLRVRRGSEPSLSLLVGTSSTEKGQITVDDPRPLIPRRESIRESDDPRSESSDDDKKMKVSVHGSLDRKKLGHSRFTRGTLRTSLSNQPEMYHWLEAQEKAEQRSKNINAQERMGPIEGHDGKDVPSSAQPDHCLICLHNDGGPLGIHAIPAFNESGKDIGLLIQSIERDRPVHKDGRIQPNDIIVEINGNSLQDVPFLRAQNIFRAAMDTKEIRLKIVKGDASNASSSSVLQLKAKQKPPPIPPAIQPKPRSHAPIKPSPLTLPAPESKDVIPIPAPRDASKKAVSTSESVNGNEKTNGTGPGHKVSNSLAKIKPESLLPSKSVSPSNINVIKPGPPIKAPKKVPPALPARNPGTSLTALMTDASLNAVTNTRKIGKKLVIQLRKGPLGLGFSITSRDNQTDGNCPIYIRNILPKGAAVQNGQLRPGDRLLEVNGVQMTGKTQAEAVYFLRMLPEGSVVDLVLSRQEEVDEKFRVPRQLGDATLPENEGGSDDIGGDGDVCQPTVSPLQPSHIVNEVDIPASDSGNEKITLHIPLNDTGSAGLGVSVKGKSETSDSGVKDLGIFVKTVLQGGAAYKDGRLRVNDKLLEVNGVKLKGLSNTSAMEALRVAMMEDSQIPGVIKLTISRRACSEPCSPFSGDSPDNSQMDIVLPVVQKRATSASNVGIIVHQRSSSASETASSGNQNFGNEKDMPSPIPPYRSSRVAALRDHFTDSASGLRNESYTKATHESFNESNTFMNIMPSSLSTGKSQMEPQSHDGRNVWIDENTCTLPNRPHSTIGFMHGKRNSHSSTSDDEVRISVGSNKDENDLSPSGDIILPFAREGFGRQSMSEKRKGHLDPRSTEIYKLVKASKENKGSNDAIISKGPLRATSQSDGVGLQTQSDAPATNKMMHVSSNSTYQPNRTQADLPRTKVKRASSLEDLVNTEPGIKSGGGGGTTNNSEQNHDVSPMWRPSRFGRARACNDSFRAAVDRSYDALDPALMDTLEEESAESGAFTFEPSHSSHSSISSEATNEDSNSLKRRKAKEKEKKGLLKGFLRFGKGRKSDEDAMRRSRSEERSEDRVLDHRVDYSSENTVKAQPYGDAQKKWLTVADDQNQQQRGRKTSHQEQERIDEDYAKLRDQHVSVQRLRSQSVDPTIGRSTVVTSPSERASPFHLYPGSSAQRQYHLAQQQMDRSDPRNFHPASVIYGSQATGYDYFGKNQSYSNAGPDLDGKVNTTKAVMSRAEYIQHLRSVYQQRHRQRQGVYPLEDREEQYEVQLQERENKLWDPLSIEYETYVRDSNLPRFIDRPPSRQTDQKLANSHGSSFTLLNTNNSTSFYPGSHHPHHQQHQQYDSGSQPHPGSRPQSRTGRGGVDPSSSYHQHNNYSDPLWQHRQHHYPQQAHEHANAHFQDQYSSSDSNSVPLNYHVYEPRSQHFYSGPDQSYHPPPNQYNHHRGNAYADSSSTKV